MTETVTTHAELQRNTLKNIAFPILFFLCSLSLLHAEEVDHSTLIDSYEGSKTCRSCHNEAVEDVIDSIHYKYMGETQGVYDMFTNLPASSPQGKVNRY